MKLILILITLMPFLNTNAASILDCNYDGDDFNVILESSSKRTYAHDNFESFKISCRRKLAALYDGDDFKIYDAKKGTFERTYAKDGFNSAQLSSGKNVIGLYDGDDFKVYDADKGTFERTYAKDDNQHAKLRAGQDIVALYDGDDFKVYDLVKGQFQRTYAKDDSRFARIVTGNQIALLYDGDDIKYYCNGAFGRTHADDNQRARVPRIGDRPARGRLFISLQVGSRVYTLNKTDCKLSDRRI